MVAKWQAKRAEAAVEEEEEEEASRPQSFEELEMAKRRRLNEWKESLSTCVTPLVPPDPPRECLAYARSLRARSAHTCAHHGPRRRPYALAPSTGSRRRPTATSRRWLAAATGAHASRRRRRRSRRSSIRPGAALKPTEKLLRALNVVCIHCHSTVLQNMQYDVVIATCTADYSGRTNRALALLQYWRRTAL